MNERAFFCLISELYYTSLCWIVFHISLNTTMVGYPLERVEWILPRKYLHFWIQELFLSWLDDKGWSRIRKGHSPLKNLSNGKLLKINKYWFQFSIKVVWEISNWLIKAEMFTKNISASFLRKVHIHLIQRQLKIAVSHI